MYNLQVSLMRPLVRTPRVVVDHGSHGSQQLARMRDIIKDAHVDLHNVDCTETLVSHPPAALALTERSEMSCGEPKKTP